MFSSITSHLFAGNRDAAIAVAEEIAAMNEADGDHAATGGITEYMGDIMLDADLTDKAGEYYDAALAYRQQSSINDANKAQAGRNHQFKSAITALVAERLATHPDEWKPFQRVKWRNLFYPSADR